MPKTFCFDIDGVIMSLTPNNDYNLAQPIQSTVDLINELYNKGHYIIVFTARGYVTGIDWKNVTEEQFKRCGLKYHELKFGKPAADYYIDDKLVTLDELQNKLKTNQI